MIDSLLLFLRKSRVLALILTTIFALTTYATGQFIFRSFANDPQVQIAQDTANGLNAGLPAASIAPAPGKTITQGSSIFVVVYDLEGKPIAGSSLYKGSLPKPPVGVFTHAGKDGQNRVTWQPERGLRFATVIVPYKTATSSGYVMAARSLAETEDRISQIGTIIFCSWVASFLLILLTSATGIHHVRKIIKRKKK